MKYIKTGCTDIPEKVLYVRWLKPNEVPFRELYKVIDNYTLQHCDSGTMFKSETTETHWRKTWPNGKIVLYFEKDLPKLLSRFPELINL